MKKMLAILAALMLAMMPALGLAEQAGGMRATVRELIRQTSPTGKYMLEGEELTADISMEVSDELLDLIGTPEDVKEIVRELLKTFGFRVTAQTTQHLAQVSAMLTAQGEEAVGFRGAYGNRSLYLQSGALMGDRILKVTWPQIKELIRETLESEIEAGNIPREPVDSLKRFYHRLRENPGAALRSLVGQPDFQGLISALAAYPRINVSPVTEAPEAFPEAGLMAVIPVQKEGLKAITDEIAKLIWSLPAARKLGEMAGATEETLVSALAQLPEALAEDGELAFYAGMDGTREKYLLTGEIKVRTEEGVRDVLMEAQAVTGLDGELEMEYVLSSEGSALKGAMEIAAADGKGHFSYRIAAEETEDRVTYQPVEMIWAGEMDLTDGPNAHITVTMRVCSSPDEEPLGAVVEMTAADRDMGDHAEGYADLTVSLEDFGMLYAIHETMKTDLAEAYIITPDAEELLAMGEEEMNAMTQEMLNNIQMLPARLIQYMPESLIRLFMQQ